MLSLMQKDFFKTICISFQSDINIKNNKKNIYYINSFFFSLINKYSNILYEHRLCYNNYINNIAFCNIFYKIKFINGVN